MKVDRTLRRGSGLNLDETGFLRAGITGVGVRYVLAFGLVGIIVAFILVAMWFYR